MIEAAALMGGIALLVMSIGVLFLGASAAYFMKVYEELVEQVKTVMQMMVKDIQKNVKSGEIAPDFLPDWLKE